MKIGFQVTGLQALKKNFANYDADMKKGAEAIVKTAAKEIEYLAKDKHYSYKYTHSKGGIGPRIRATGEGLNWRVVSEMHYSPYVEFGTGHKVLIPKGLEEYAANFKGANQDHPGMIARPFLYPASQQYKPTFKANLKKLTERLNRKYND